MVRRIDDKGGHYHEPPYTWEEEMELYRPMSPKAGRTLIHAGPRGPQPPEPSPPPTEQSSSEEI